MFYQALLIQARSWINLTVINTYYYFSFNYLLLFLSTNRVYSVSCSCLIDITCWNLITFFQDQLLFHSQYLHSVTITLPVIILTAISFYLSGVFCELCFIDILLDTDHFLQYQLLTPPKYSFRFSQQNS